MKANVMILTLLAAFCTGAAAQDLAPHDAQHTYQAPPQPVPVPVKPTVAPAKLPTFESLTFACYGQKTRTIGAKKCLTAADWSDIAAVKCKASCVKVPEPGGKVIVKCGVNLIELGERCD